jgi:flagellin
MHGMGAGSKTNGPKTKKRRRVGTPCNGTLKEVFAMALNVNTNVPALNTTRVLNRSTNSLNKSLERLSSGLRINRAADDASGLYIAEGLNSIARGSLVAQRNAQDAISLVQTAEGALVEVGNMLQRMRELSVQAASGTNNDDNRAQLQKEVDELILQIDSIAEQTSFNGKYMIDTGGADYGDLDIQIGASAGEEMTLVFNGSISANSASYAGLGGVDISTQGGAETAITTVNDAIERNSGMRAQLGAYQNRLEFTINNLATQEENNTAAESRIRDADIARETIQFTRNQILVSTGTSILAQANVQPQQALQLLG